MLFAAVPPAAAPVLVLPLAVAPAAVVSLSDLVLDCSCVSFLLFAFAPLCFALPVWVRALSSVEALVLSVGAAAPRAPDLPSAVVPVLALPVAEPELMPVSERVVVSPAPVVPVVEFARSVGAAAPRAPDLASLALVLCAAANWLNDTASTLETNSGKSLRMNSSGGGEKNRKVLVQAAKRMPGMPLAQCAI